MLQLNLSDSYIRYSTEVARVNNNILPTDSNKVPLSPSINEEDNFTESSLLKAPLERWIETQNRQLNEAFFEKR